jgi:AraC family transcriptional regulator of adaptative response / DNA-3-methyladenine glycosylase II
LGLHVPIKGTLRAKPQRVDRYLFDAARGRRDWLKSTVSGGSQPKGAKSENLHPGRWTWAILLIKNNMELDRQTCAEARKTRDPRFDGRIFIGVLSSGVYCRPICPARTAKERNVRYFASAAAAAEAGFRPCLRCRPECSPGTPAWMGTSATVSRALRLIGESPLADGGVDALASRLGIGSRHLRRLFQQHLGAPPIKVAQTRRLHFAKKLIDETTLSMEQVARAAGFGSVRHFNATICETYKRTPTHIRKLAHQSTIEPDNEYLFRLRFRCPFEWNRMLAFLSLRATPGVEVVEGGCYRRTISLNALSGCIEAFLEKGESAIAVRICFPDPRWLFLIVERIRYMFDLNADPFEIAGQLGTDPLLAKPVALTPGLRVPGCWDGFELAVRAVLGQQVTVKGASTLAGRLVEEFGIAVTPRRGLTHLFPLPNVLAGADLARVGLPAARAETIRGLASAVRDGRISFAGVVDVPDFLVRFRQLPGIGDWTAQYVAMRAFGDPDAFPSGDLGLLRAAAMLRPRELEERSHAWRPWRAYAAMHLWQSFAPADPHVGRVP